MEVQWSAYLGQWGEYPRRMLKKFVRQGRSERRTEAYPLGYVEDLNDARTKLADFFSTLLGATRFPTMRAWEDSHNR